MFKIKPLKCPYCWDYQFYYFVHCVFNKSVSILFPILNNFLVSTGEKSYNCDKCEKTFTQKKQLKSHYRVHTGKKTPTKHAHAQCYCFSHDLIFPLYFWSEGKSLPECDLCQHKFMDAAQLKKHIRTHTGKRKKREENLQAISSSFCPETK